MNIRNMITEFAH